MNKTNKKVTLKIVSDAVSGLGTDILTSMIAELCYLKNEKIILNVCLEEYESRFGAESLGRFMDSI